MKHRQPRYLRQLADRRAGGRRIERRVKTLSSLWLIALFAVVVGCRPAEQQPRMHRLEPPPTWAERLQADRQSKDISFGRDPSVSPLPAEQRDGFRGLDYWEPDPRYYFVGRIQAYPAPERLTMITTAGQPRPCERIGWIEVELPDGPQQLQVYRLLDQQPTGTGQDLFLPFQDSTTGEETYHAGRYLNLDGPPGGPYVLDFNRAYNPHCAYGAPERFACPVTPKENRLDARIAVGERNYAGDHAG